MSEKRYQIFLSSTYTDLIKERDRVLRELAGHGYIASGMEYFPAMDEEQFEFIKTIIDGVDFYVAIVAGRYGSLAPDGIGYSEKEFDYAVERSIPVIALLHANWSSLPSEKKELDESKIRMLERYRAKLSTGRLVKYWRDESELCIALLDSLNAMSKRFPRLGWIRGTEKSPEELLQIVTELKAANEELRTLAEGPLSSLVRWRLRNNLDITYSYKVEGSYNEATLTTSWNDLTTYVLPRLKHQQRLEKLYSAICEFVESKTKRAELELKTEQLDVMRKTMLMNGLLACYVNRLGEETYGMAGLGWDFVGDAVERYDAAVESKRNKELGFWSDIGRTIARHMDRLYGFRDV